MSIDWLASIYEQIWCVDFEYYNGPSGGDAPRPICMVARNILNGDVVRQWLWDGATPKQVGASIISWQVRGVPVVLAGHRERAGRIVSAMLRRAAVHRYRELRCFAKEIANDAT